MSSRTWGLALSGGAAYGIANIGVLEVLEREGLFPSYLAGSSMGAIVGAVYALGHPSAVLRNIAEELSIFRVARMSKQPFKGGLHGGALRPRLQDILEDYVGDATIGDCRIPFVCVAGRVLDPVAWHTIIKKGFIDHFHERITPHIFSKETRILDAILASSAIPVVFSPMEIAGQEYVDLVHFGSIPTRVLRQTYNPDTVIATDTNPSYASLKKFLPEPWEAFLREGQKQLDLDRKDADLLLAPKHPYPLFRFDRASAFIAAGKKETEQKLPEILTLLGRS